MPAVCSAVPRGTLGTFAGVFTPSILTILGIILFMRMGYVVGSAGLSRALVILALANGISVLTSLSLSAMATNLRVKRGGDYYLISRTLGHEFGGAIGLVMFLAQSISIGFYCIGFAEVLAGLLPAPLDTHPHFIAAAAAGLLFVFAWLGADWATRFQYVVMTILAAALASFFAGALGRWDGALLAQNWSDPAPSPGHAVGFWVLFALFFPAVTGFTQGVSMSGDLEDPGRSLPLGTLLAVGLSILVYLLAALAFAGTLPREELVRDYAAMDRVALIPPLILAGVFAATLSSAMASFMGAPRILQSLAEDRLFHWLLPFAKGSGPMHNPRRGILLSGAIALATISLGQLDLIAPVVSMFFLISYGLINYATFFEARAASPSFRPRFRFFHRHLSLLGALGCLGAMLAIDLEAGLVAVALLFAIYEYLRRTAPQSRWADGRRSYHTQRIRTHLLAAAGEAEHPRDWRPNILLFSDDRERRAQLLELASWLGGDSGFATLVKIIEGRGAAMLKRKQETEEALKEDIRRAEVQAFSLAMVAPDVNLGIHTLVQSFGIGHLRANIILLNWLERAPQAAGDHRELVYGRQLRTAFRLGCNLVVLDGEDPEWASLRQTEPATRRIDVWWRGDASSRLMLLLAHLMTRTEDWEGARIRLLGIWCTSDSTETAEALRSTLDEVRIDAEAVLVEEPSAEAVARRSADASLVFLPFRLRGDRPLGPFDGPLEGLLAPLPVTVLVLAAEDMDLDAEPEEGTAAETARVLDALSDAERLAELTALDVGKADAAAREGRAELEAETAQEGDADVIAKLRVRLQELDVQGEKARRRAARMAAKAEAARQEAQALGLLTLPADGEPGDRRQ
ncbi:MAG: amino acid permease [Chromatiaceae bacterium]|nr:amino acid permease [Chromatiaceae bacterium]